MTKKKAPMTKNKIELMKWIVDNSKGIHNAEHLSTLLMPELKKIKRGIVKTEKSIVSSKPKKSRTNKNKTSVKPMELMGTIEETVATPPSKMTYNRIANNTINNNEVSSRGDLGEKTMTIDDIDFKKSNTKTTDKYLTAVSEIKKKAKDNKDSNYIPQTDPSVKTYAQIIERFNKQP